MKTEKWKHSYCSYIDNSRVYELYLWSISHKMPQGTILRESFDSIVRSCDLTSAATMRDVIYINLN